ncbi:hypothetical protein SOVF_036630 [Spinacia oleracea]|nr:hypothetical protein SOVF_036630 [Spinacia oleracea]
MHHSYHQQSNCLSNLCHLQPRAHTNHIIHTINKRIAYQFVSSTATCSHEPLQSRAHGQWQQC